MPKDPCLRTKGLQEMCAVGGEGSDGLDAASIWKNAGDMGPRVPRNQGRENPLGWWGKEWELGSWDPGEDILAAQSTCEGSSGS